MFFFLNYYFQNSCIHVFKFPHSSDATNCDYFGCNCLCERLHFFPRSVESTLYIAVRNNFIENFNDMKFLGLNIEENLNWSHHPKLLCSKLSKNLYLSIIHYASHPVCTYRHIIINFIL